MRGVVHSLFALSIPHGKLQQCIRALEEGLRGVRETPYHAILGRDFLHHREEVARFVGEFFKSARSDGPVGAMYFEMNGFTINPDRWYFNGFGYRTGGNIWELTWDLGWLTPWDVETDEFTLSGMETVQNAFAQLYCDENQPLSVTLAAELAEHIVVARFNELVGEAHKLAKENCLDLAGLPILSTAHDWDVLSPST
jgi:hypothetical protein